ncbi:hypothetical protein [Kamptonema sp. UHCC 0994]|nr:hypothetical protein [Kamptonema sp. UHCC 0994]MDF0553914.1 hypothetical protein [Kamptonema sp. UHCC 0994]
MRWKFEHNTRLFAAGAEVVRPQSGNRTPGPDARVALLLSG